MDYLISFLLCLVTAWFAMHLLISTATKHKRSNQTRLPPGPKPLPIVGNLFSLGSKPHVSLAELAKTYGPLMILHLGQVPTALISSAAVAKQVFQKHDVQFSNRTVPDALCALDHHQNSVGLLPAGPKWRNLRRICNTHIFSSSRIEASQGLRRHKIKDLLSYVKKCSNDGTAVEINQAAFVTTLNLLSNTIFSADLADFSSESARRFKQTVRVFAEEAGKPNVADYFPVLRRMDPQGFRKRSSVHIQTMKDIFKSVIDQRILGERPSGLLQGTDVLDALLGINQEKIEEIETPVIPDLFVDLFVAGTDTTSSTLEWAMAELIHNPEKLNKAQTEIKQVIGKGNPVEESDIARLPYLQAVVKETLRLHPPVPFLIPRQANSEVSLWGFTVPKNAQVLINVWAIGKDPDIWENPNSFLPERFMGNSECDVKGHDFELIPFGAGRRICPGLPLAIRVIPLMLGSLIHEFNWELEGQTQPEKMDMEERFGFTLVKAQPLRVIPT